jgi:ABC-type uncharacterized transport system substrate-binding protein
MGIALASPGLAAAGILALPLAARAQRPPRLGVLLYGSPETDPGFRALRAGLKDVGLEGAALVVRGSEGLPERLPGLAAELVQGKPDVIVALGGDVAPFARAATTTIPIVISVSSDPVAMGMAASFARPGGNVTGLTFVSSDLAAKRVEILRELMPRVSRVGMIWNPGHLDPEYREAQRAGNALGISIRSLEVRRPADIDDALRDAADASIEALMPVSSRLLLLLRPRILRFGAERKLPVAAGWGPWATEGALFSYGPDIELVTRRSARYVQQILRGARAADLPIELPTRFELVINDKVARALGLAVPQSLVLRADRVIE